MLICYSIIAMMIIAWSALMFKAGYEAGYSDGYHKAKDEQKVVSIRNKYPNYFS